MIVLTFPESAFQAALLAKELGVESLPIKIHRFPDGESKLTLPDSTSSHVILFRSLNNPNSKLVELVFTAQALRDRGVERITLVAPYLCYMRQDKAFNEGEIITQKILGSMLADYFDDLITVDPHLHRISRLEEAIPLENAVSVSATGLFGAYLKDNFDDALLLGPDEESFQWVAEIAAVCDFEFKVAEKIRYGDRQVSINLPEGNYKYRKIVLVDDVVSTAQTLIETVKLLKKQGVDSISVLVTHPLFANDSELHLKASGADFIGSSDSIPHSTNVIALAPVLAEAINRLN